MVRKKGLSQVVSVTVMILITVALVGGVWTIINTFLQSSMEGAGSCMGVFEELTLNPRYTCYNTSSDETLVSIIRGDLDMNSILISVSYGTNSETIALDSTVKQIDNFVNYPDRSPGVTMVGKDSGRTFILTRSGKPESVQIAPKIGKKQCDVSDQIMSISNCN